MGRVVGVLPGSRTQDLVAGSSEVQAADRLQPSSDQMIGASKLYAVFLDYLSATLPPWSWAQSDGKNQAIERALSDFNFQKKSFKGRQDSLVGSGLLDLGYNEPLSPKIFKIFEDAKSWLARFFTFIAVHHKFADRLLAALPPISWVQNYHKNQELTRLKAQSLFLKKESQRMTDFVREWAKSGPTDRRRRYDSLASLDLLFPLE